ncbi:hypothetical protein TNCV_3921311 [Trichonephila clavipes]|nr:hypothetical protein TNCV_3921311 [Trichonephila clavipes]
MGISKGWGRKLHWGHRSCGGRQKGCLLTSGKRGRKGRGPKERDYLSVFSNTSTYTNSELRDFQISPICPLIERKKSLNDISKNCMLFSINKTQAESVPDPDDIGNVIEEVVEVARELNLQMNRDDVKKQLDLHN